MHNEFGHLTKCYLGTKFKNFSYLFFHIVDKLSFDVITFWVYIIWYTIVLNIFECTGYSLQPKERTRRGYVFPIFRWICQISDQRSFLKIV